MSVEIDKIIKAVRAKQNSINDATRAEKNSTSAAVTDAFATVESATAAHISTGGEKEPKKKSPYRVGQKNRNNIRKPQSRHNDALAATDGEKERSESKSSRNEKNGKSKSNAKGSAAINEGAAKPSKSNKKKASEKSSSAEKNTESKTADSTEKAKGGKRSSGSRGRGGAVKKRTARPATNLLHSSVLTPGAGHHSNTRKNENNSKNKKDKNVKGKNRRGGKLRVIPLGGLEEIGKNMTVLEYGDDIIVIDCGMGFPDEDMPGIDLVIPDVSYLVANAHKVRGILITHGHEDHIGAVPYILQQLHVPVYGTRLSLGIIEGKLEENPPPKEAELYTVEAGDVLDLGVFKAEFIHVNHSIADACAIAIRTPVGIVYHTGDFKIDVSPIDGQMIDLTRIGELGREGVELLLCESTNAERSGFTPSERTVGSSLERIFGQYEDKRLIIATFSSNIHRVQQIINTSYKHGRKVAVLGRSMVNVIGAAAELGYMDLPDGVLIDISEIKKYKPEQLTLITTGSQGEPMSALYRIAFSEHDRVKLSPSDVVVLSSSAIPGNEKLVGRIINAIIRAGVKVVNDSVEDVHVSGHACREEIKLLMGLLKPKYLMPIHGEYRHLYANKDIGEFMGIPSQNIFVGEIGRVLELDGRSAAFVGDVPAGRVLVDGAGVGDIGSVVLRERKHLAEDGLVVVVATVQDGLVVSGPEIITRGFVYVKESEELMGRLRRACAETVERAISRRSSDIGYIKNAVREELAKLIFNVTRRKPMILSVIMEM